MSELSVGSLSGLAANSYVIDVASGSSLDLSNGATLPAGSVAQVVSVSTTTDFTVSSTSQTPWTGMSLSITPSSATSKILLIANAPTVLNSAVTTNNMILIRGGAIFESAEHTTPTANYRGSMSIVYLDSPATTSPTTYSVSVYNAGAGATGTYKQGSLTAIEVLA